jgi:hypothetical protein
MTTTAFAYSTLKAAERDLEIHVFSCNQCYEGKQQACETGDALYETAKSMAEDLVMLEELDARSTSFYNDYMAEPRFEDTACDGCGHITRCCIGFSGDIPVIALCSFCQPNWFEG